MPNTQDQPKADDAINDVKVEGASEKDKEIFYTALYHTMIDPRAFSDVNGNYIGADNEIHKAEKYTYTPELRLYISKFAAL